MTYIIDLQHLWEGSNPDTTGAQADVAARKNVVSVIVVASRSESLLIQTLQSVLAQQFVREVIIVNCEEQPSLEKALAKFVRNHPKCYHVRGHKNAGLAAAYNLGAQHASGQFLLFIKGNCILAKNATAKLLSTGMLKPAPWVVGAAEKPSEDAFKPLGMLSKLFANSFDALKYEGNQHQAIPEVSLPGGGFHAANIGPDCLFLSTQSFLELKGLDKKCFHSTFHMDLCLRIHYAGGGVYRAREFDVVAFKGTKQPFRAAMRNEWQAFCGRFHFYQKYVSRNTNKFLMVFIYGALAGGFMVRCLGRLFSAFIPDKPKNKLSKQTSFN